LPLKRGKDSNIEVFGIIDITVVVAILIVIFMVQFGGVVGAPIVSGLILGTIRVLDFVFYG